MGRALELRFCIRPFCYASGLTVASCRPVPSLVASLVLRSRAIFVCRSLPKHDGLSLTAPCFQDVQSWLVRRSVFLLACVRWLLVKDASFDYGIGCSGGGSDVFVCSLCICCGPIRGISCHPGHRVQTATCSHNCPQQLSPLPVARMMAPLVSDRPLSPRGFRALTRLDRASARVPAPFGPWEPGGCSGARCAPS